MDILILVAIGVGAVVGHLAVNAYKEYRIRRWNEMGARLISGFQKTYASCVDTDELRRLKLTVFDTCHKQAMHIRRNEFFGEVTKKSIERLKIDRDVYIAYLSSLIVELEYAKLPTPTIAVLKPMDPYKPEESK